MITKIHSGDSYKVRWEKVNQLIDAYSRHTLVAGNGIRLSRTAAGTLLEAIPSPATQQHHNYEGPFCCSYFPDGNIHVFDPFDMDKKIAGYAYINGVYTEVKAETVPLDEEKLTDGIVTLPDGKEKEVKEGYISLALDPEGKVFFALTPQIIKRIYTGEFSVEYNHKEDQLVIVDGSDAKSQYAGSIFRNGEYYHVPAGSLEVAEGTLCLVLDSSGEVSYKIVKQPAMRTYDGEFTVQYDPESGLIEVFDGTYGTGNAGHVFLDGKWTSVSAASIIPKEGYLCLRYSAEEGVTFSIVDKPAIKLERWEKPAEAPEEETEEKKG